MPTLVHRELDADVLRLRLRSPATGNVFDLDRAHELQAALDGLEDGVRVVALLADGPNFCLGGDVRSFAAAPDPQQYLFDLADAMHVALKRLAASGLPVVVGAQGWVCGAGLSLLVSADVTVLGRSAKLRPSYTAIGISPDCGQSWNLPRAVGRAIARDMLLTNRVLTAEESLSTGLGARVVDDADVEKTVESIAAELAAAPIESLRATRRLIEDGATRPYAEHLDFEARSIAACAASPEGREGVAAFLAKRAPNFRAIAGSDQ